MSQIIAFPTPTRREAVPGAVYAGELVAFGRNDIETVIETISLLREGGLSDMLDEYHRGPIVPRRRRASATA
jgi:hypothetical protein